MDKSLRNTLRNVVTQCRKLLEDSIADTLEGQYGVYRSGKTDEDAEMVHLSPEDRVVRERILIHLKHIQSGGFKDKDAVEQLTREVAYTHLNRLSAYKMMEKRGLIREAVSRGVRSQGLSFYLADHPDDEALHDAGKQDVAYRHFLTWQGAQFSDEIGVLFAPTDLANALFPPQRVIDEVLTRINSDELKDIWAEDEAIGWIYQYFTPKELRDKARAESQAPRNSYELSFRNQFFTPRYVVEFLTDNTLGRIWYEMLKGDTALTDQCRYFVRRPTEIFLSEGKVVPEMIETAHLSQEELLQQPVYIPHRPYKDPRRLRVLDPACGSGHFLLYAFDLLAAIYEEAWERDLDDPATGSLRADYPTLDALRLDIPRLILAHNLHGIDIDARATQIAALALWLRAQRYYQAIGLKRGDERPKITRGNIVCAEPMPGDSALLDEFSAELQPKVLGQLVRAVFNKMKLAGEAGSLLKIEEELQDAIEAAKKQYVREQAAGSDMQTRALFPDLFPPQATQLSMFDLSDLDDATFFNQAEKRVLDALHEYARQATNGKGLQRQLFADDAAQGFAFIDVCRKRYDVVLMNPPFGSATQSTSEYFPANAASNLYAAFVLNALHICQGYVGAITDRSFLVQNTFKGFRETLLSSQSSIDLTIDLGWGVLDTADVQVAAYTVKLAELNQHAFVDVSESAAVNPEDLQSWRYLTSDQLKAIPDAIFAYSLPTQILGLLGSKKLREQAVLPRGLGSNKAVRTYKVWYEVPIGDVGKEGRYRTLCNGGDFSPFYRDDSGVADWVRDDGKLLVTNGYEDGFQAYDQRGTEHYFAPGLSFPKQSSTFNVAVLTQDAIPTREGKAIVFNSTGDEWSMLGYLNSALVRYFVDVTTGLHKQSGSIGMIPIPDMDSDIWSTLGKVAAKIACELQDSRKYDETARLFTVCYHASRNSAETTTETMSVSQIDSLVAKGLNIDSESYSLFKKWSLPPNHLFVPSESDYLSFCIGLVVGRWDIRYATGEKPIPALPDPFAPLPACPPGMLQSGDGLPLTETPPGYPLGIQWDGILVDDEDHSADVVVRARQVIDLLWGERADAIEREACEILGVNSLRDYFRKSGKGGFWDDHVKRYSKSRRQAPIYWLLQSSKKNYGLWLYYHRLDKDILYKALVNYVEPKIRLEESRLNDLHGQLAAAGNTGSAAKKLAGEVEKQEALLAELDDFHDKLSRAASLNLTPDLNDGVVLNIAPLWELVPWKVAKEYWDELMQGKYEWSMISGQLRDKGLI